MRTGIRSLTLVARWCSGPKSSQPSGTGMRGLVPVVLLGDLFPLLVLEGPVDEGGSGRGGEFYQDDGQGDREDGVQGALLK